MNKQMLKCVVVPTDFSEMSGDSLKQSLAMVDSADNIEVVHVTPYPAETAVVWGQISEEIIVQRIEEKYREFAENAGLPDLRFTTLFGDPGSRISEFAKEKKATLVVIGSHGRTGLKRMLLGSVAERVVRMSPCPVLVLRSDHEE